MIIMIGGVPCSGKSTLTRNILSVLGSAEFVEPMKLFPCQKHELFPCQKHDDVLVVGRYEGGDQKFGGTDRMSYGAIPKFRDFINQEAPKHKHIFLEGDRFFRAVDIEWLISEHNATVYVLTVSAEEEKRRHIQREDTQTEKWLAGRRSQISNIMTNFMLMNDINVRPNDTLESSEKIKTEIIKLLT